MRIYNYGYTLLTGYTVDQLQNQRSARYNARATRQKVSVNGKKGIIIISYCLL